MIKHGDRSNLNRKGHIPSLKEASVVTQGKNPRAGLEDTEECCLLALLDSPESSAPPTMD